MDNRPTSTPKAAALVFFGLAILVLMRGQRADRHPGAAADRGAALYAAHCASCHGANLEGQPDWKKTLPDGSLPAPPHDDSGHTWHHGDGELLRIIARGGMIYMPESKMPGFAGVLSDDEMHAVLAFIKSSWGDEQRAWQAQVTAGEIGPVAAP